MSSTTVDRSPAGDAGKSQLCRAGGDVGQPRRAGRGRRRRADDRGGGGGGGVGHRVPFRRRAGRAGRLAGPNARQAVGSGPFVQISPTTAISAAMKPSTRRRHCAQVSASPPSGAGKTRRGVAERPLGEEHPPSCQDGRPNAAVTASRTTAAKMCTSAGKVTRFTGRPCACRVVTACRARSLIRPAA